MFPTTVTDGSRAIPAPSTSSGRYSGGFRFQFGIGVGLQLRTAPGFSLVELHPELPDQPSGASIPRRMPSRLGRQGTSPRRSDPAADSTNPPAESMILTQVVVCHVGSPSGTSRWRTRTARGPGTGLRRSALSPSSRPFTRLAAASPRSAGMSPVRPTRSPARSLPGGSSAPISSL